MKKRSKYGYIIGRPAAGVAGNHEFVTKSNKLIVFTTKDGARTYLQDCGYTNKMIKEKGIQFFRVALKDAFGEDFNWKDCGK